MTADQFFRAYFPTLAGVDAPYEWQAARFHAIVAGQWPDHPIALPTGTGKTAVMQIWLLALAWSCLPQNDTCPPIPRRLAWVVNRRVVVDQATAEADRIAKIIGELAKTQHPVCTALQRCSGGAGLLAVSTLRGQKADNREWSTNPAIPAIVVGTVDMIGSRLLFRGYGDSRYRRPIHAGLLGVDTLIVNDEAHLSPAFAGLLLNIASLSPAARFPSKTFRVLLLSATSDNGTPRTSLEADLAAHEYFRRVYTAPKRLYVHEAANKKDLETRLYSLATAPGAPRTILFVEQPEEALKTVSRLQAQSSRAALLTGTMRGWERDHLAATDDVFRAFACAAPPTEPHWLVATSAGEVGVNLTCERLVSALVEADRLVQRFGRLNRFPHAGENPAAEAHVVYGEPGEGSAEAHTIAYLTSLQQAPGGGHDISCQSLYENVPPPQSRSAEPLRAALEIRLLDLWSQTTATGSAIPPVAPWLHGKQEPDQPETEVAWREDVQWLAKECVSAADREQALEHYPVLPHERLSEPARRVHAKLSQIAQTQPSARVILIAANGSVESVAIAEIARRDASDLNYARLLLPSGCGAVVRGMFQAVALESEPYDVADNLPERRRARYRATHSEQRWHAARLGLHGETEEPFNLNPRDARALANFAAERGLGRALVVPVPVGGDEETEYLLYFRPAPAQKHTTSNVAYERHAAAVAGKASELSAILGLPELQDVFRTAGERHDAGKLNRLWQRAIAGDSPVPLAKAKAAAAPSLLAGFRHELESLLRASGNVADPLVLHLIASHHGWARPYFEPKACSREQLLDSAKEALESARRFGSLQAAWGHWGLAYLEAVFKAADALASGQEGGENA